jgi:hypothetical protein
VDPEPAELGPPRAGVVHAHSAPPALTAGAEPWARGCRSAPAGENGTNLVSTSAVGAGPTTETLSTSDLHMADSSCRTH